MTNINFVVNYDDMIEITVNDQVFHLRKQIPFEQKVAFAEEYAQMIVIVDDNGLASKRDDGAILDYLRMKYYSDVDMSDETITQGVVSDFFVRYDIEELIYAVDHEQGGVHWRDFYATKCICYSMIGSVIEAWKAKFSLANLMNGVFSHQIEETIAKSNLVNEEMIDLLNAKTPKENASVAQFPDFAKKKT